MNPTFKAKYSQMQENRQASTKSEALVEIENDTNYAEAGHIRNLYFSWPDGRMKFLNYSYLVSCECLPQENCILMEFTTDMVRIKGFHLERLFHLIRLQVAMGIFCTDARYNDLNDTGKPIVNEISINKNL